MKKKLMVIFFIVILSIPIASFSSDLPPGMSDLPPGLSQDWLGRLPFPDEFYANIDHCAIYNNDGELYLEILPKNSKIFLDARGFGEYYPLPYSYGGYFGAVWRWSESNQYWYTLEGDEPGIKTKPGPVAKIDKMLFCSKDIYTSEDLTQIYRPADEYTYVDFWANVNIVLPRDGFMDNIHAFSIGVITDFTRHLTDDEINNIKVDVLLNGVKTESFDVIYNKVSKTEFYSTSEFQLLIDVPVGFNEVEVLYYYDDVLLGSDSVTFTRLQGFVDEDGDGLDDRTGNTYIPEKPINPIVDIEKPEKPGEDGNAIDWLKYLGEYIGYIFEILINSISNFAKNVVSGIGSILGLAEPMFSFINQFFSSMPVEIRTAILAMFSVSVFLVIMKMIRG